MRNWTLLAACLLLMVTAQTLWKVGLEKLGALDLARRPITEILRLARSWQIVTGILVFAGTTFIWLDLLSRFPLSQLYPMMSLVYVVAFFIGWILLGETPSLHRFIGILVICLGVYIVARSGN